MVISLNSNAQARYCTSVPMLRVSIWRSDNRIEFNLMEDYEKRLIGALNEISVCLGPREKRWSEMWRDAFVKAQRLFESGAEVRAKYDFVTRIRYYYGGMGSFNDIWIPDECEQLKTDLYQLIKDARRQYWRQLGNKWHDYSRFQLLPNGNLGSLVKRRLNWCKEKALSQALVRRVK